MRIPRDISKILSEQKETGMGYQLCTAEMKDGNTVDDILVANGDIIISISGNSDVSGFKPEDIVRIAVKS